jgi:hypothetical protein
MNLPEQRRSWVVVCKADVRLTTRFADVERQEFSSEMVRRLSSASLYLLRLGPSIQPPRPGFTKSTGGNAMFNFGTVGTLNYQQKPSASS